MITGNTDVSSATTAAPSILILQDDDTMITETELVGNIYFTITQGHRFWL